MTKIRNEWQLQRAKAEFSKLVKQTLLSGPQVVTRHGVPTVVVLSIDDFTKLRSKRRSFKDFLRDAPLSDLDLKRQRSGDRAVDL